MFYVNVLAFFQNCLSCWCYCCWKQTQQIKQWISKASEARTIDILESIGHICWPSVRMIAHFQKEHIFYSYIVGVFKMMSNQCVPFNHFGRSFYSNKRCPFCWLFIFSSSQYVWDGTTIKLFHIFNIHLIHTLLLLIKRSNTITEKKLLHTKEASLS